MPMKRKSYASPAIKRARRGKRPRYGRGSVRRSKITRRNPTYKFKRNITSIATGFPTETWTDASLPFDMYPAPQAKTEWPITYAFQLSDVSAPGEFTALFDRYRIVGCMLKFYLSANPNADVLRGNQIGTLQSSVYPRLWYKIDHDDAKIETLAQLRQCAATKCRVLQPNRPVRVYVPFPRSASSVQIQGSAVASAMVNRPAWFDMDHTDVLHYGLKAVVDLDGLSASSSANGSPFRIRMEGVYYFQCKDVR